MWCYLFLLNIQSLLYKQVDNTSNLIGVNCVTKHHSFDPNKYNKNAVWVDRVRTRVSRDVTWSPSSLRRSSGSHPRPLIYKHEQTTMAYDNVRRKASEETGAWQQRHAPTHPVEWCYMRHGRITLVRALRTWRGWPRANSRGWWAPCALWSMSMADSSKTHIAFETLVSTRRRSPTIPIMQSHGLLSSS